MGGWPVGYLNNEVEKLNSGPTRTNPDSSKVEHLNQRSPHFKSSTLNCVTMVPPLNCQKHCINLSIQVASWLGLLTWNQFLNLKHDQRSLDLQNNTTKHVPHFLWSITYVLLQAAPSPVNPLLQMQLNESGTLIQVALWWHWSMPNLHSSTSGHSGYDHKVLEKKITVHFTALFNNMRILKFKGCPTNAFFAAVNQMFGGSSQLTTTAEHFFVVWTDLITAPGSSRKLGGAAEHLIDSSEKRICWLSFEF